MIEVTTPTGSSHYFNYLEEIAEWLTRVYGREVLVSDYENQLLPPESDFVIFGEVYHFKQVISRDEEIIVQPFQSAKDWNKMERNMRTETLLKANEIRRKIESLNEKIDSISEISKQATSPCSMVGLKLEFFNVKNTEMSFGVSNADMGFIINYLTESWQYQKNELEAEFEQL